MGIIKRKNVFPALPYEGIEPPVSGQLEIMEQRDAATKKAYSVSVAQEGLFISKKKCKSDFVLVRELSSSCFSVIHLVEIEGKVQQMELRYINNAYELELLKRTRKLCTEGLYVELEAITGEDYKKYERVARVHLKSIIKVRRIW